MKVEELDDETINQIQEGLEKILIELMSMEDNQIDRNLLHIDRVRGNGKQD